MRPRNRDEWRQAAQAIIAANRQLNLPKRCESGEVGGWGECLHCEADQGEHCKHPPTSDLGQGQSYMRPDPFAAIPEGYFWMAAKGRLKPSEPLYAVQIIDAESGIHVAAAEAETLEEAIAASVQALTDAALSRS